MSVSQNQNINLSVQLPGLKLKNPIIPASGTFGFGYEFARFYDLNILGSMSLKGTTLEPRFGNPLPRIAETPSGLINSIGLQNPGIDAVLHEELPKLAEVFNGQVLFNVSGFSTQEYLTIIEKIGQHPQVGAIELNISCPNVHGGGLAFGGSCEAAGQITAAAKKVTQLPIIVKLSPNVGDIVAIAQSVEAAGADGISLINTVLSMRLDQKTGRPIIANKVAGLSGPAIFPLALRMVYQVSQAVKIPVIGLGGISSAQDVIEMMSAGAAAVQVGTQNLIDPYACAKIIEDLPAALQKIGVTDINEIIGRSHRFA